jgi:hypothetical protein
VFVELQVFYWKPFTQANDELIVFAQLRVLYVITRYWTWTCCIWYTEASTILFYSVVFDLTSKLCWTGRQSSLACTVTAMILSFVRASFELCLSFVWDLFELIRSVVWAYFELCLSFVTALFELTLGCCWVTEYLTGIFRLDLISGPRGMSAETGLLLHHALKVLSLPFPSLPFPSFPSLRFASLRFASLRGGTK